MRKRLLWASGLLACASTWILNAAGNDTTTVEPNDLGAAAIQGPGSGAGEDRHFPSVPELEAKYAQTLSDAKREALDELLVDVNGLWAKALARKHQLMADLTQARILDGSLSPNTSKKLGSGGHSTGVRLVVWHGVPYRLEFFEGEYAELDLADLQLRHIEQLGRDVIVDFFDAGVPR